jgi:hypothetical protein
VNVTQKPVQSALLQLSQDVVELYAQPFDGELIVLLAKIKAWRYSMLLLQKRYRKYAVPMRYTPSNGNFNNTIPAS